MNYTNLTLNLAASFAGAMRSDISVLYIKTLSNSSMLSVGTTFKRYRLIRRSDGPFPRQVLEYLPEVSGVSPAAERLNKVTPLVP